MTKQLALRLVTPHAVFSSRVTSSSSENTSLSLCFPPQAQTGTAALPVVLVYIPLVLQPPSLSQLFSFFFFLLNRHLQAHAYCQAVVREITVLCKFTFCEIRFSQLVRPSLQEVWTCVPVGKWINDSLDASKIITACLQILCSAILCTL